MDYGQLTKALDEVMKDFDEADFIRINGIMVSGVKDGRKIDKQTGALELRASDGRCLPIGPAPQQMAPRVVPAPPGRQV